MTENRYVCLHHTHTHKHLGYGLGSIVKLGTRTARLTSHGWVISEIEPVPRLERVTFMMQLLDDMCRVGIKRPVSTITCIRRSGHHP